MPAATIIEAYEDPTKDTNRLGRCYEIAGRFASHHDGVTLVHGSIQGFNNPRIDHAWVELPDGSVWEPASGHEWDRTVFDGIFRPQEKMRFNHMDTLVNSLKAGHWGPWDSPVKARTKEEIKAARKAKRVIEGIDIEQQRKLLSDAFSEVHDHQRYGGPEDMFDARHNPGVELGTGIWRHSLEHGGDLVHRLSYAGTSKDFGGGGWRYGREAALEKAERLLRTFKRKEGWMDIKDDVDGQLRNNFDFRRREGETAETDEQLLKRVRDAGERYAQAYEAIRPVTEVQKLGRDVAIAIGRFNFDEAEKLLRELIKRLKSPAWEQLYWTPLPGWKA